MTQHTIGKLSETGAQWCLRCGHVVTKLRIPGHIALEAGAVYSEGKFTFEEVPEMYQKLAIPCSWLPGFVAANPFPQRIH